MYKKADLITNLEHGDVDKGQHEQVKGDLSLNLNWFQTEGTNIYDFDSYVKVHTVVSETKDGEWNNDRIDQEIRIVKLLTAPTARLKSPVRLGIAPPSKTGSLTQLTPSNPNSNPTRMTPTNLRKTLTHLTQSDPAKRIRSLIRTYGQTSFT